MPLSVRTTRGERFFIDGKSDILHYTCYVYTAYVSITHAGSGYVVSPQPATRLAGGSSWYQALRWRRSCPAATFYPMTDRPDTIPPALHDALADRYRVEREIGRGGMATVFLAHDLRHERPVAIKLLHEDLGATIGPERFLAEIKVTAKLQHPHVLSLIDSGRAGNLLYYVMPFVDGESLRDRLDRERVLPLEDAVRLATEVADALAFAHAQGVVHRDIKPANILLQGGHALVADFGIALAVQSAGGARLTQTGLSLGTPQYMSPEQAMGEQSVDARSDLYALGAVTYEMLTGDPPFTGATVQSIVAKVLSERPTPPSVVRDTVPEAVEAAVMKALAKLPADRFADARAFAAALALPATSSSGLATGTGARRASPPARPSRAWPIATGVMTAVAAGSLALLAFRTPDEPDVTRAEVEIAPSDALTPPSVALAPDGRALSYCNGNGRFERRWSELRGAPAAEPGGCALSVYSPDGAELAVIGLPNSLRIVSRNGSRPPRTLAVDSLSDIPSFGGGIDWASDGNLYVGGRTGLLRVRPADGASEFVARVDSLTGILSLDVLPDAAASIVVVGRIGEDPASFRVAALRHDTGSLEFLLLGTSARYSAALGLVVAQADGALVVVPFDARALRTTGDPAPLGDRMAGVDVLSQNAFDVTASGMIVYTRWPEGALNRVAFVSRDGTVEDLVPPWEGSMLMTRLSPDGRRLAVEMGFAGVTHTWLREVGTGQATRLTSDGSVNGRMSFTPDGDALTIVSDRDGTPRLYTRRVSDGRMTPLPRYDPRVVFGTEWSRDGRWLLLRTDDQAAGAADILAVRPGVDTVARPVVASPTASEYSPSLSPDGRWLAYVSNESGQYEVWVTTFPDGGAKWQVTSGGATEPVWSRDGRELFFVSGGQLVAAAVRVDEGFEVTGQQPLFPTAPFTLYGVFSRSYDVAPDGQRFLMLWRGQQEPVRMVVVTGWRAP